MIVLHARYDTPQPTKGRVQAGGVVEPRQEELFLRSECEYNFHNEARGVRVWSNGG